MKKILLSLVIVFVLISPAFSYIGEYTQKELDFLVNEIFQDIIYKSWKNLENIPLEQQKKFADIYNSQHFKNKFKPIIKQIIITVPKKEMETGKLSNETNQKAKHLGREMSDYVLKYYLETLK